MRILVPLTVLAAAACGGESGLTSKPVGAGDDGAPVAPQGEGEGEPSPGPAAGEGEADPTPDPAPAAGEGEGEADPGDPADPPGQRACVQREREDAAVCGDPCDAGCADGTVCLTFPEGKLCLPNGEGEDGRTCTSPADCAGGLCVWSGGGPALCTKECPAVGAGGDAVCGDGRSCLPSTTPAGSFHCYATGALPIGDPCLRREGECEGGYCLGAGQAAYCTAWCDPAEPADACPAGWSCRAYGEAHLCCDPNRTQGGC